MFWFGPPRSRPPGSVWVQIIDLGGILGSPDGLGCKESTHQCRRHRRCGFDPWVGKIPWRRTWQPTPIFLPGEFHGQRSWVGYSSWSHKEFDMTKLVHAGTHTHQDLEGMLGSRGPGRGEGWGGNWSSHPGDWSSMSLRKSRREGWRVVCGGRAEHSEWP